MSTAHRPGVPLQVVMLVGLFSLLVGAAPLYGVLPVPADTLLWGDDTWAPPLHPELARADSLFTSGDPEGALTLAGAVAQESGEAYEPLWRAASYALGAGILASDNAGTSRHFDDALELARRARQVHPEGVAARYWEVAALGQLALGATGREAAEYAEGIRGGARAILEVDPEHAGAHHALGKLYLEIMGVSRVSRLMGRTFTDSRALDEASWERAERHLKRAVELAPEMLLFQLDLARFHRERDQTEAARAILERLVKASVRRPPDRVFQEEGREMLKALS